LSNSTRKRIGLYLTLLIIVYILIEIKYNHPYSNAVIGRQSIKGEFFVSGGTILISGILALYQDKGTLSRKLFKILEIIVMTINLIYILILLLEVIFLIFGNQIGSVNFHGLYALESIKLG